MMAERSAHHSVIGCMNAKYCTNVPYGIPEKHGDRMTFWRKCGEPYQAWWPGRNRTHGVLSEADFESASNPSNVTELAQIPLRNQRGAIGRKPLALARPDKIAKRVSRQLRRPPAAFRLSCPPLAIAEMLVHSGVAVRPDRRLPSPVQHQRVEPARSLDQPATRCRMQRRDRMARRLARNHAALLHQRLACH
jgi:hypothetical protein